MKTRRVLRSWLFLIVPVLGISLMLSCSSDKGTEIDDPDCPDRTTADGLLKMFANAYAEMNLLDYDECLDESFLFMFTDEIADSLGLPQDEPWWGKTEDIISTRNMFEDPVVLNVAFSYEALGEWAPCHAVRDDTTFSGFCRTFDPLIEVTVSAHSEYDPILKFRVDDSFLDVMVVPDRFTDGLWCILRIEEVKKQHLRSPVVSEVTATEPSTWGGIKSMW